MDDFLVKLDFFAWTFQGRFLFCPWTSLKRRPWSALYCLRCSLETVVHLESLCLREHFRGTYMANASSLHYKQDIFLFSSRDYLVYSLFYLCGAMGIPLHRQVGFSCTQKRATSSKQSYRSPSFVLRQIFSCENLRISSFPPFLSSQMLNTGDADLMVLWFQLLLFVSSC